MEARERFLASVLDSIEEREVRLLAWGIVDGNFSHEEISDLLNPLIDTAISAGLEDFSPSRRSLRNYCSANG